MNDFDMNLIKPFVKVYELNSITKAADFLNVSQPAISGSIKRLETYLDYPLFIRNGRNLTPTSSAKSFYAQVSNILDIVDNALGNKDEFVVYAQESILLMLSNINKIQLIEARHTEEETFNDLRMRKADLVIDNITYKDNTFVCESVRKEYFKLVCRQGHPTVQGRISLEQYYQSGHVATNLKRHNQRAIEFLAETPISANRNIKVQVSNPANMMLVVQNTDYIAGIPESMTHIAEALNLQVIDPPFAIKPIEYFLVYHKRFSKNTEHKKLREQIRSILNNF